MGGDSLKSLKLADSARQLAKLIERVDEAETLEELQSQGVLDELAEEFQVATSNVRDAVDLRIERIQAVDMFLFKLKEHIKALKSKETRLSRVLEYLKQHTAMVMLDHTDLDFRGSFQTLKLQRNGGKPSEEWQVATVKIDGVLPPNHNVPHRFVKLAAVQLLDKEAVLKALAEGDEDAKEIVRIQERGYHVRIR